MSVPSELLLNTQNSFQTHAQRGANIVQRGGKRKSRRKKGGEKNKKSALKRIGSAIYKKLRASGDKEENANCVSTTLYGSQCQSGHWCEPVKESSPRYDTTRKFQVKGNCKKMSESDVELFFRGGKRKSKRTKRMARKSRRRQTRKNKRGGGRTITFQNLDHMANSRLGKMVPHGDPYTNCNTQSGGAGFGFTREGAADAATFKGSYPAVQKYEKSNQCGGKRRRRRKSRRKRRKSRRKSRKSRRKRRRSRRRRRRRRRAGSPPPGGFPKRQRGGSSASYAAPFAGGEKPWATAPLGIQKNGASCYDNYNHYKGL